MEKLIDAVAMRSVMIVYFALHDLDIESFAAVSATCTRLPSIS